MQSTQPEEKTVWFCLISHRKREHIAAAQLAEFLAIKVFAPRIRFRRPTRNGPCWITEALFPSYFFAKINLSSIRRAHYAPQVRGIVHFGSSWPTVPDAIIEELEKTLGGADIHLITAPISPGDKVKVMEGTFQGFEAIVARVMPARERIKILLDFLGRQTVVEMGSQAIFKTKEQRESLFKAA
jgi:transcriptional antiterminator RfaH